MRNFILFAFGMLMVCSCVQKRTNISEDDFSLNTDNENTIVETHGHRLLRIKQTGYKSNTKYQYVHSVDCPCGNVTSVDTALYFMYNNIPSSVFE